MFQQCSNHVPMKQKKTAKLNSFPTRSITISDEVWSELRQKKLDSGWNWDKFIKELTTKWLKP